VRALALIGFMGSGKSTVARLVAERAGAPHRDLDRMIEERCGMPIAEIFATRGEAAFRALESELLPEALLPGAVVSIGGGAPLAEANWAVLRERALTVWLDAPLPELLARAGGGTDRPLLAGRSASEVERLLETRLPRYREANHRVRADRAADVVAEEVLELWRR
jgi:shikimate kinase